MQTRLRIEQREMPWLLETPPMCCYRLCRHQEPVPVGSVPIVRHTRYWWAILWVGGEPEHRWTRGQSGTPADAISLVKSVVWWGARGRYCYHDYSDVACRYWCNYHLGLQVCLVENIVSMGIHWSMLELYKFPEQLASWSPSLCFGTHVPKA